MVKRCPHCRGDITPFPLFKKVGDEKKPIWKNWFRIGILDALFFISIIIMVWGYKHDTEECYEILEHPCEFVEHFECMKNYIRINSSQTQYDEYNIKWESINLPTKNVT